STATAEIYTLSLHDALPIYPIERFGEVVFRAQLNALHHAAELVQGRDHNHRNITQPDVFLHVSQRFETVQFRHHDIEQNEIARRSEEHTSELQSRSDLVCRL